MMVAIAGLAILATDRISLLLWRARINAYYRELRASADQIAHAGKREVPAGRISWAGTRDIWQVPLLEVSFGGPAPESVVVDGNGGLSFVYAPPICAWSRHAPWAFNRSAQQGSDIYAYNDVYILKIETLEGRPGGRELPAPSVTLDHGFPF
jgi:hypothetical protein